MTQRGDLNTIWPGGISGNPAQAVHISNPAITMEWSHHKVHAGKMFSVDYYAASVASSGNADLLLTVGAKEAHIVFDAAGGAELQVLLYEDPNATGGTPVTVYNANRSTGWETPALTIAHTPSITAVGTNVLVSKVVPGGSGGNKTGGSVRNGSERILRASTKYLIRATNKSTGAVNVSISIEFYEEPV